MTKLLTNLLQKKVDIENFESNLMQKQRIVIIPIRLRHELDTLAYMRSRKEVAGVIKPRADGPPTYFVLHNDQVRALKKQCQLHSRPVYVEIDGEQIRCTLHDIRQSVCGTWYTKVYFERYVLGQPNEIKVGLSLAALPHARFARKKVSWNVPAVTLLCEGDNYPPKINIDASRLVRKGKYTFGDLVNQLPAGLQLHPRFMTNLNFPIAFMEDLYSKREQDHLHLQEQFSSVDTEAMKKLKGITEEEEEQHVIEPGSDEKKKKKERNTKTRSIKKLLKGEQEKLKAEIEKINLELEGGNAEDDKDKKKGK